MTVQNTNRKDVYLTNGTTIYWPYTFEIFTTDGSDLALYETNLTTGETKLIDTNLTRDIINSRIKYPRTGSPRPAGYKITVARITERTQGADLQTQTFDPKNMERGLDKLTAMVQEIDETVSRAAVADISQQGVNFTFPSPVGGKVVGWNAEGTGLINLDNTTLGIEAQMLAATEAAQTAADKVDSILEPDGVTVKEATHATSADNVANSTLVFSMSYPEDNTQTPRYIFKKDKTLTEVDVYCVTAPTALTTITIYKNGSSIANFTISSTRKVYSPSPTISLALGDIVHVGINGSANNIDLMTIELVVS